MSEYNRDKQNSNLSSEINPEKTKDQESQFSVDTASPIEKNINLEENVNPDDYVSFSEEIELDTSTKKQEKEEKHPSTSDNIDKEQIRIKILEEQLDKTKQQMIRALADAENTRKRARKEREDASKFAISKFARDILSVADNLRRALESIPVEIMAEFPQVKNLTDGIEATERELMQCFEKNGIIKIDPLNEKFDPNFHEVMFETPMNDKEHGTIIQVMEAGYKLNDRILRPARVGICKNETNNTATKPSKSGQTIDTQA